MSRTKESPWSEVIDIAPDMYCSQCGPVILCPHNPVPINPSPPRPRLDYKLTDNFLENMRRRKAAEIEWTSNFLENSRRLKAEDAEATSLQRPADIAQPGTNPGYVTAAIHRELGRLAEAVEGTRNDTLNRAAFAVFGFVKGGHADEQAVRTELDRIASVIGLSHNEIQATLRSAWSGAVPRDVPAPRGAA